MATTADHDAPWLDVARDVVRVAGPDALDYLHGQVSQDLRGLDVGATTWTFLLEPTGKVSSFARVRRVADDELLLDTDAGYGDDLLARIDRFKLRVRADTEVVERAEATLDDLDPALERDRVAAGWPRLGREIVPGDTIPGETGATSIAVSFTKGCYPGQELVERMDSRQATAPRSTRRIRLDATAGVTPAPGDPVLADGVEVGRYTSVADDVAIALVKRGAEVGEPITLAWSAG